MVRFKGCITRTNTKPYFLDVRPWQEMKKEYLNNDELRKIGKFRKNDLSLTKNLEFYLNIQNL